MQSKPLDDLHQELEKCLRHFFYMGVSPLADKMARIALVKYNRRKMQLEKLAKGKK